MKSDSRMNKPNTAPISVIIPAYNAAAFLRKSIESVLSQTLPVAEIIVVNDGSVDDTSEVARSYGVRVIDRPNGGLSAARNTGIREATQPWIALLDADDIWEPQKIEEQWDALQLCGRSKLICSDFSQFDESGTVRQSFFSFQNLNFAGMGESPLSEKVSLISCSGDSFWESAHFIFPSTVIIEKDLMFSIGGFDEELKCLEDVDCFLRAIVHTPLLVVKRPLVKYRLHAGSLSSNNLRMYESFYIVANKTIHSPSLYPTRAKDALFATLPEKCFEAGRLLLDSSQNNVARKWFMRSFRLRPSLKAAVFGLLTWLPPRLFQKLVGLKRRWIRMLKRS